MKKQLLALALAGMMALSLAGCGSSSSSSSSSTSTTAAAASGETEAAAEAGEAAASDVELPKKIEMQVPASAGGGTDVVARALSSYINSNSDSNTTVVNNTDGSGVVAMETVRTGKADGSELLFFHTSMCIKTATGVYEHTGHEDFKVIGAATPTNKGGYILVTPAGDITDVDSFVEAAKAAGGNMMIGVETGGSSHIMAGMLSKALGIELKYVEAGADTDKLTALVGGSINCALVNANQAKQYIEAGKVNAIACFSATDEGGRNDILPDVPSFAEQGYDGCVYGTYFYILANPEMDDATAQAILALFDAAAKDPDTAAILESAGMGMEFVPYEDAQPAMQAQQESLNVVCEELGLSK
ncbi:MAG: tripartite tricarboxylate transporter substrate binding protein [Clostridiales bacterium]|nr:tripartite tricarboxylate transporter substrate binding protein [Clostridiales bacterium]